MGGQGRDSCTGQGRDGRRAEGQSDEGGREGRSPRLPSLLYMDSCFLSEYVQAPGVVFNQWEPPRCAIQMEPIRQPEGMACEVKNWGEGEEWKVSLCYIILAALEFHT